MLAKRISVFVLSAVLGVLATLGILALIRIMQSNVDVAYYGYEYFALTALFVGAAFFVWLDHFMKTNILPR